MMKKISTFFLTVLDGWYYPQCSWPNQWIERLWVPTLFLIGLILWGSFLNWGNIPIYQGDWGDITTPRLFVLQDAVRRQVLPFHTALPLGMKGVTDRFLGIPDIILSPQVLLLAKLDPGLFILLNTFLLYSIGFTGLYVLRRKFRLGLASFSVLFFLFMLNGHIEAHIFIGHATWLVYFLYPFFILLIFTLLEKRAGWGWVYLMSLLLLLVFLQGGFHHYVMMILFIFLLGICNPIYLRTCLVTVAAGILICLFRILPVSTVALKIEVGYLGGFTSLNEVFQGLIMIMEPSRLAENISRLNPYVAWWEFDYYIGWMGLIFILVCITLGWRKQILFIATYKELIPPLIIFVIFSIGRVYRLVFLLNIPMLNAERVGSRFFLLPFLFILVAAAVIAQQLLQSGKIRVPSQLLFLGAFILLINDLQQHTELWNVQRLDVISLPTQIDPSIWVVANHPDPIYEMMLMIGSGISLLSLLLLTGIQFFARKAGSGNWLNGILSPFQQVIPHGGRLDGPPAHPVESHQ